MMMVGNISGNYYTVWQFMKKPEEKDEPVVTFKGAKLTKNEANQTGIGIISGIVGILVALVIFGADKKLLSLIFVGACAGIGFVGYGYLKKKTKGI